MAPGRPMVAGAAVVAVGASLVTVRLPASLLAVPIVLPYVLGFGLNVRRRIRFYDFSLANVILLAYTMLFPLRLYSLSLQDFDGALILGEIGAVRALETTALAGAGTAFILVGYACTVGRRRVPSVVRPVDQQYLKAMAGASLAMAALGLACMLAVLGGPLGIYSKYASHEKGLQLAGAERLGYTLWALFLPLGLWTVLGLRGKWARLLRGLGFGLLLAAVLLFGSRLTLLVALVGAWPFWAARRGTAALKLAVLGLLLLAVSLIVVADRTETDLQQGDLARSAISTGSYSVLDSAAAVWNSPERLRDDVLDPERIRAAAASFVPSVIWPDKPSLQDTRLDSAVAFQYGNSAQRLSTGFPASFLLEGLVVSGGLGVAVLAVLFGAVAGCVERIATGGDLTRRILVAAGSYTAFTFYKDGDIVTSSVAGLKLAAYALLLSALVRYFVRQRSAPRDRACAGPELGQVRSNSFSSRSAVQGRTKR